MPKTIEEYRALGFDEKSAAYFASGRRTLLAVKANEDESLTLLFDKNERLVLELSYLIRPGTVFERLKDRTVFERVFLDDTPTVCWDLDENTDSSVVWNNRIDLCPDA